MSSSSPTGSQQKSVLLAFTLLVLLTLLTSSLVQSEPHSKKPKAHSSRSSSSSAELDDGQKFLKSTKTTHKSEQMEMEVEQEEGDTDTDSQQMTAGQESQEDEVQGCTVRIHVVKKIVGKCVRLHGGSMACQSADFLDPTNEDCLFP